MTTTPPPQPGPQPQQQNYGTTWEDPPSAPDQPHRSWGPDHPPAPPVPPPPEPARKSWFRRHKILTALLAIVALAVVVNLAGGEEGTTADAPDPAAVVEEDTSGTDDQTADQAEPDGAADEGAAEAVVAQEPTAEDAAPEEDPEDGPDEAPEQAPEAPAQDPEDAPAPDTPGLGDAVRDGGFEFTVNEVRTGVTTVGEGFAQETPQGQFVLIDVTVSNIGDKGSALFDSAQVLIDDEGRQHETSSSSIWLEEALSFDEINPGNAVSGVLLYDIPTDAVPTSLELHDSMFSGGVTVTLQ